MLLRGLKKAAFWLREDFLNLLMPLVYLAFIVLLTKTGHLPNIYQFSWFQWLLVAVLIFGLLLWGISYLYLPPQGSFVPKAKSLITSGPYRFFRHPIYLGVALVFVNLSLLLEAKPALWYTLFFILPVNLGRAIWEEKILNEIFGQKYQAYKKKTLF